MTASIHDALVAYAEALASAADRTHQADERPRYEQHLAAAARMFVVLERDPSAIQLKRLVEQERRSYGWSFLSGTLGNEVESAFAAFAAIVSEA